MQAARLVNFHTQDYRSNFNGVYGLCSRRLVRIQRDIDSIRDTRNISCQCNIIRNYMCTCSKLSRAQARYFSLPKQVYQYPNWRLTDIGIGDIKTLPRRRIRKIYLPQTTDRAVGSEDLSSCLIGRSRHRLADSYYDNKRTSSKCVGGFIKNENISISSQKISPIVQKKSGSTSPEYGPVRETGESSVGYNIQKDAATTPTQIDMSDLGMKRQSQEQVSSNNVTCNNISKQADVTITRDLLTNVAEKLNSGLIQNNSENLKDFSSESFVQHVHNLENPSDDKQSKASVDLIENKSVGEDKEMFTSESKDRPSIERPTPEFKSASLLRRRFEALRRGLCRNESKKESVLINKLLSYISVPSRKDVSVTSHPPNLQGRSYSNSKISKPLPKAADDYKAYKISSHGKRSKDRKNKDSRQWLADSVDNDGVQEMNGITENKFDDEYTKNSPKLSNNTSRNTKQVIKSQCSSQENPKKKQGRKFFFFRNKSKEKENKLFKTKKGVTTARCEVKDGLMIKVGGATEIHKTKKEQVQTHEKRTEHRGDSGSLRRDWLETLVTSTEDSRNNVHIRWNNNMYAPSSSTVLELIDSVYKHNGIDFRSRSVTTTNGSTNYRSFTKRLHFMKQNIEAWMLPKTVTNMKKRTNKKVYYSQEKCAKYLSVADPSQKWFVDASSGLSERVQYVLHAIPNSTSSEYVIISIPDDYFSGSNSNELRLHSSDEKIYNIVEYETPNFKKGKEKCHMATGDGVAHEQRIINDVNLTVNVGNHEYEGSGRIVNKEPTSVRNISIQASNVSLQKRCDVIEVGIITQRDIRDGRQPILRVDDDLSDEESEKNVDIQQKKCELADSYVQNYYRNWMSSGIDLFSWHQSDSHYSSGNNSVTSHSQGDGSKSCPKIYNDFQDSTVVLSSCETSSCSHCVPQEDERKQDDSLKSKILNKFKRNCVSETPLKSYKRNFPKDSLEVFRKRRLYACMDQKSNWRSTNSLEELSSEIKKPSGICPRTNKPCWRLPGAAKENKSQKKRVSLSGLESAGKIVSQQPKKSLENIVSSKETGSNQKSVPSPKGSGGLPKSEPQPPVKESLTKKKPASIKKKVLCSGDLAKKSSKPETLSPKESPKAKPTCDCSISAKPKKPKCTCLCPNNLKKTSSQTTQMSRTTSQQSGISLKICPSPKPSKKDIKKRNKNKQVCKPDCAYRKKKTPPPSPPKARAKPLRTDCLYNNKNKISGLYLKKLAVRKNCDAYMNWNQDGIIRLNSQEKITIQMNKETPSTGDVQEGLNIKVQDQDGQTLYETIDYKQKDDRNKGVLLKDMYTGHHVQRVSTPTMVKDIVAQNNESEVNQKKSDTSTDNLIEINLTLKMKPGDKGTKVDIQNNDDVGVKRNMLQETESQNAIYTVKEIDRAEHVNASENKKDVNIKIVIKNYNNDSDKTNETENDAIQKTSNDNFTKRISEKFQTVSTAYSDVLDHQTYSVQRATVNMTTSTNICEVHGIPTFVTSVESLENVARQMITSSQSTTEVPVAKQTADSMKDNNKNANSAERSKEISQEEEDGYNGYKTKEFSSKDNYKYAAETIDQASNESTLHNKVQLSNKAQKTEILKKLLRSSSVIKKLENKRKLKDIIHAILISDSSENEDVTMTSNELLKELTYTSLGQSCFKDTDSMNNYYQLESDFSVYKKNIQKHNPSKDDSECWVHNSAASSQSNAQGCLCSTLAAKLKLSNGASTDVCCCRQKIKQEQEINCDILARDCSLSLKTCVDVETQNSKHVSNKINATNPSTENRAQSIVVTNASVTVEEGTGRNPVPTNEFYIKFTPDFSYSNTKCRDRSSFKREKLPGLSAIETFVPNSNFVKKSITEPRSERMSNCPGSYADILQMNEIKKAVLEIYAEKVVSNEGDTRIVSKLPKFDLDTENNIFNYVAVLKARKRVSERSIVMMSVKR